MATGSSRSVPMKAAKSLASTCIEKFRPVIGPRRRSEVALGQCNHAISQRDAWAMSIPAPIVRHTAVDKHDGSTRALVYVRKLCPFYPCSVHLHRPRFYGRIITVDVVIVTLLSGGEGRNDPESATDQLSRSDKPLFPCAANTHP